jgi:hypothetical protein
MRVLFFSTVGTNESCQLFSLVKWSHVPLVTSTSTKWLIAILSGIHSAYYFVLNVKWSHVPLVTSTSTKWLIAILWGIHSAYYFGVNPSRRKGSQQYRLSTIDAHAVTLFHRELDYTTETTLTCRGVIAACSCELSYRLQGLWSYFWG